MLTAYRLPIYSLAATSALQVCLLYAFLASGLPTRKLSRNVNLQRHLAFLRFRLGHLLHCRTRSLNVGMREPQSSSPEDLTIAPILLKLPTHRRRCEQANTFILTPRSLSGISNQTANFNFNPFIFAFFNYLSPKEHRCSLFVHLFFKMHFAILFIVFTIASATLES